jgi:hypothetical protein
MSFTNASSVQGPPHVEPSFSAGQRLIGTLFWPGQTFADINRKSTWIAPVLIAICITFATGVFLNYRLQINWDRFIREHLEASGNPAPSDEVVQRQASLAARITSFTPYINSLATQLISVVLAAMFAVGMMLLEAQTTFKKVFSVVVWSSCALELVATIATVGVVLISDLTDFDPTKSSVLLTSLEILLPSGTRAPLRALAASFDVFTFWFNILLVIGLAAIGGSRKITKVTTAGLVFGLWGLFVLIKIGWAAIFGL